LTVRGDGGRPATSVKSAATAVAHAREKEREKEKRKKPARVLRTNYSCQSDWRDSVTPQQMARLVDTRHKIGTTSATVHTSAPLVTPVRLARLLYKSRQTDWRDTKGPDMEKHFAGFISRIIIIKRPK
jgi:hypothetical protein